MQIKLNVLCISYLHFNNGPKEYEDPVENPGWESEQFGERGVSAGGKISQDFPESF